MASLAQIQQWWSGNIVPSIQQRVESFSSFRHKDEAVPITDVEGLVDALNSKLSNINLANKVSKWETWDDNFVVTGDVSGPGWDINASGNAELNYLLLNGIISSNGWSITPVGLASFTNANVDGDVNITNGDLYGDSWYIYANGEASFNSAVYVNNVLFANDEIDVTNGAYIGGDIILQGLLGGQNWYINADGTNNLIEGTSFVNKWDLWDSDLRVTGITYSDNWSITANGDATLSSLYTHQATVRDFLRIGFFNNYSDYTPTNHVDISFNNYALRFDRTSNGATKSFGFNPQILTAYREYVMPDVIGTFQAINSITTTAPTSSTATGSKGEVRFAGGYRYDCINQNVWIRTAVTTTF